MRSIVPFVATEGENRVEDHVCLRVRLRVHTRERQKLALAAIDA